MNHAHLFSAGVIAGVGYSVLAATLRAAHVPIDSEMWLGTLLMSPGSAARLAGFLAHLTVSGFIGILYGHAFNMVGRYGPSGGTRVSFVHMIVSGLCLGALPGVNPAIPELLPAPGVFLSAAGLTGVLAFLAVHLLFGAIMGAIVAPLGVPVDASQRTRVIRKSSPQRRASGAW